MQYHLGSENDVNTDMSTVKKSVMTSIHIFAFIYFCPSDGSFL